MSSCTECHGAEGRDHTSEWCPRLHPSKPHAPTASDSGSSLREQIAVNIGCYYRESDKKWLREKHDNGRYLGIEDFTPEVDKIISLIEAHSLQERLDELDMAEGMFLTINKPSMSDENPLGVWLYARHEKLNRKLQQLEASKEAL